MKADVITIGDEILIGQVVDSNSAVIAKTLNKVGIEIREIRSISDSLEDIIKSLKTSENEVPLVLITGGLGPTKDDVTKSAFCQFFDDELVVNQKVLKHIETLFKTYTKTPINDLNRAQAALPSKATIIPNNFGTATGLWMEKNHTVFVAMPGVPFEMKAMLEGALLPKLVTHFRRPSIVHKTLLTYGLGESIIAEKIADWEASLPPHIRLAYLPNFGRVRLRLSAKGTDEAALQNEIDVLFDALYPLIGDHITGFESEEPIEQHIGNALVHKGWMLAIAESCTGGNLASLFTQHAGASAYFKGSVVAYATELKTRLLGVAKEVISEHSVVSEPVALAMAKGVLRQTGADVAVATTGNFGPTKGDAHAEIGTVVIAIITPEIERVETFCFGKHRERNLRKTLNKALELLFKEVMV